MELHEIRTFFNRVDIHVADHYWKYIAGALIAGYLAG